MYNNTFIYIALVALPLFSCKKSGGGNDNKPAVVPAIKIENAQVTRMSSAATMRFNVSLNNITTVPVSVDYTLADGTATSPKDYTKTTGTVNIPAGSSTAEVAVQVTGDATDTRQDNLDFSVSLINPKGVTISTAIATGTIISENGMNFVTDNAGFSTPATYPGMTLVWGDEFSGTSLDMNAWNYELGNGASGWGNNELEYYTNTSKNSLVSNGNLIIEARKESVGGFNYTSARLTTQGKKSFTFGRIDIRAKLPRGRGVWPALWMLGSNVNSVSWPRCGEIDIMEYLGHETNKTYGTLHWGNTVNDKGSKNVPFNLASGQFYEQFHVFSVEWKMDQVKLLVDNNAFYTLNKSEVGSYFYPFNLSQFFIFNVAVGGNWPGSPDAATLFPQRMIVDYVRVFQ